MATITKSYESNNDLTIFTVVGETSFDEIWTQTCILLEGVPAKLVLLDFTSGTVGNISSEEVRSIADRGARFQTKLKAERVLSLSQRILTMGWPGFLRCFAKKGIFPLKLKF
ncbi:MAG: hypothetical protein ACI8PB_001851 [Desulforhopalus sp.]|jgi:hypothetical protein